MQNKIQILFTLALIIASPYFIDAQTKIISKPLQELGVLDSLYSESLEEHRRFYVQLPTSYEPGSNQKYPVCYILDGEMLLPTVHNVQEFYSGGYMPEMVLIGIVNDHDRTKNLTISKIKNYDGKSWNENTGGASDFIQFIEKELIPLVEQKFPVTSYRTLIGHSYGGLFTIYTLLNYPELFSNYLAIDPSLDWDGQAILAQAKAQFISKDYKNKSLFISLSGQLHMQDYSITIENVMQDSSDFTLFARSNINFSNFIQKNKGDELAYEWKFYPRDLHGTVPFPSIMDGLIFNFAWYQMEKTDRINSFDTPKEELKELIRYRATKLRDNFGYAEPPYPVELLNMSGYMNMDMEQYDKAKMYFDFAIEYYPNDPNVYDSMADYYDRTKDYKNALKYVSKAYEINGIDYYKERMETFKRKQK